MADNIIRNIPYNGFGSWGQPVATVGDLPVSGNDVGDIRVVQSTGELYEWNGTAWVLVATSITITGITSLNGLTASSQTFSTGTSGTNFNIVSAGSNHAFNIPDASLTARGLVTTGTQIFAGNKTINNDLVVNGSTTLGSLTGVLKATTGLVSASNVNLTTEVTGILPIANGGTNNSSYTSGSVIFYNGTSLAQKNSTFFFDNTNDRLFVGSNGPGTGKINAVVTSGSDLALNVFSIGSNSAAQIQNQAGYTLALINAQNSATAGSTLSGSFSRGTLAARTQSLSGDLLFSLTSQGYTGSAFGPGFTNSISFAATENTTGSGNGGRIVFSTTPNGALLPVTRFILDQNGDVIISAFSVAGVVKNNASGVLSSSLIVNSDVSASAAIDYSKLNLSNSIVNADISVSAAIARNKLASGSANHVIINDGTGVLSSEAQLALTRGGTNANNTANAGAIAYSNASGIVLNTPGTTGQLLQSNGTTAPTFVSTSSITGISHSSLINLLVDDHTQYSLLAGRTTGQLLNGGTNSGASLTLSSTSNVTKGNIILGTSSVYSELNDRLGIGTLTPAESIEISKSSPARMFITNYGASPESAFVGRSARGTVGSPSAVQTDDILASFSGRGYGTTDFSSSSRGRLELRAAQNWTDANQGSYFAFSNVPLNSTSITERMRILAEGRIRYSAGIENTSVNTVTITSAASPYTPTDTDYIIFTNTAGGAITINLPNPTQRRVLIIKDVAGNMETNQVTLQRFATESIEGLASNKILYTNYGGWTIASDGTNYFMV